MRRHTAILLASALVLAGAVPAVAAGVSAPATSTDPAASTAPAASTGAPVALSTTDGVQLQTEGDVASCEFPVTATDATGTEVTVEERPERVTTLQPSAAQTMWEIGGESQVVGVSKYALYLDGAESRTNVSAGFGVSVEAVVGTEPDLVLAPNVISNETVAALRESGLTVFRFSESTSIADVREKTTLIGRLTGNCEGAAEANAWMDANVEAATEATADVEPVRALYPAGGGFIANTGTFISAVMEASGAVNVAGERDFATTYPQVNDEVVVELAPEYLVLTESTAYITAQEPYASTPAVENDNTVTVNGSYLSQPAPRSVVYSVRNLTAGFHPDAAADAEFVARGEVSVETETATTTPEGGTDGATADPTDDPATEPTDEPGSTDTTAAGFGAAVAALALLASALLARRDR